MDKDIKQQSGGDFLAFVQWAHNNRRQLIYALVAVVVIALGVGVYFMHQQSREDQANEAFSALPLPTSREPATAALAAQFAQVANDYPGTSGGAHAALVAGGIYYEVGQYADAQGMFERFLAERGDSPLASEAAIGVASSLEVQGNLDAAAARYEQSIQRGQDSTWPQGKSALARIYTEQNHPDRALQQYRDMLQAGENDSWTMEARVQAGELLEKYPALRQQLAAQSAPAPAPEPAAAATPAATGAPTFNMVKP